MHAPEHGTDSRALVRTRAGERAFGVTELVVALVIILILMSVAIVAFRGARGTVNTKEAIAAANAYDQSISKFQADHANKLPIASDFLGPAPYVKGTKSLLNPLKPNMAGIPDGVAGGRVAVKMTPNTVDCGTAPAAPSTPVGSANALISYCPEPEPNYGIRVIAKGKAADSWTDPAVTKVCWIGRTARGPRC